MKKPFGCKYINDLINDYFVLYTEIASTTCGIDSTDGLYNVCLLSLLNDIGKDQKMNIISIKSFDERKENYLENVIKAAKINDKKMGLIVEFITTEVNPYIGN